MMQKTLTRERASSWSWILQAITGVLVIVLVGVHMIFQHFVAAGGLRTYADVVAYIRTPFFLGWETIFLIVVTWHALLGVRAIALDFGLKRSVERVFNWILTIIGVGTIVYGLWLTFTVISRTS
jgi:succinate dehydrogenase / fumarate reductase membrane anchor subunit